jgi:hypothetical protein
VTTGEVGGGWYRLTWFASAYDTDDIAYRVTTLLQIAGALILAAGGLLTAVTAGSLVAVRSAGR